jgi:hypothetical protein
VSSAESAAMKVNKISEQVALRLEQLESNLKEVGGKKVAGANGEKKYFVYDVRCVFGNSEVILESWSLQPNLHSALCV